MNSHDAGAKQVSPILWLVLGGLCISFSPIFIRLANVSPDIAGFYRLLFAAVSLLAVLYMRGEMQRLPRGPALLLVASGCLLAIDFMCWHRSIHLIGPGFSTLLGNFQVFFTALFAWLLFREKVTRMFVVAIFMAFFGLTFITGLDWAMLSSGVRSGIVLGLLSAVGYSAYLLFLKESMKENIVSGMNVMLVVSISGAIVLGVVGLATGASFAIPDGGSLLALLGVGVLSTTVGWSMISSAVRHVPATVAGLILLLQPALAFVWDVMIFDRQTGGSEVFGILLILSAIYLGSYRK
jgi:drug/metabolite transporter (DMT)-like permease